MSNTLINPTIIAKESLRQLKNSCVMGNLVYRGYETEWSKKVNGFKPGQSVTLECPMYDRVTDGATLNVVDLVQRSTTFTLSYRKHVAHHLTSDEMTYNLDGWTEKIIKPAMQAMGRKYGL